MREAGVEELNTENLEKQRKFLLYLHKLLKKGDRKSIQELHKKIFKRGPYRIKLPKNADLGVLCRRMFFYFCLTHYQWPRNTKQFDSFAAKARRELHKSHAEVRIDETEQARMILEAEGEVTKDQVKRWPMKTVDRYLQLIGWSVDKPPRYRRRILWEWYRHNTTNPPPPNGSRYVLRDLIIANPGMSYDKFKRRFGKHMPTVTRKSFNVQRAVLKREGYDIIPLRRSSNV